MKTVEDVQARGFFGIFPASDSAVVPRPQREVGWWLQYLTRKELEAVARQLLEEKNENS